MAIMPAYSVHFFLHREKTLFNGPQDFPLVFYKSDNILQFNGNLYEITPDFQKLIDEMTEISVNGWY